MDRRQAPGGTRNRALLPGSGRGPSTGALQGALLGAALALLAACDEAGTGPRPLAEPRTYEPVGSPIRWGATSEERFGISAQDFAPPAGQESGQQPGKPATETDASTGTTLHFGVPPGWTELPPSQFREVNLRVAGHERAECYLTILGGGGGGLEANVNRWRQQVSQPPLGEAEIAALPRLAFFGKPAAFVDFHGTWAGMSGTESEADWRLVGVLLVEPGEGRFLKMTGPADVIAGQVEAFKGLVASFHEDREGAHGHAASTTAGPPAGGPAGAAPPGTAPGNPGKTAAGAGPGHAPGAAGRSADGSLSWTAPAGWALAPPRPMREATWLSGAGGEVDCSLSVLTGDGGGLLANINRWCGQLGHPPLTEADVAALPRGAMLGTSAVLVELERGPGATAPAGQEYLLAAVCLLPSRAVFVKMTGPRAEVEGQRAAFVELCRSLQAKDA